MKILINIPSALITVFLLQACSTSYFGHTKEEWNNMTEKERIAAKDEYQTILDSRTEQTHSDIINARTQSVIDYGASK